MKSQESLKNCPRLKTKETLLENAAHHPGLYPGREKKYYFLVIESKGIIGTTGET